MVTINCTKQVAPTTERHQLLGLNPCKMSGRCLRRLGKWGAVRGDPLFWDFSAVDIQSFSTNWGAPYLTETSIDPTRCTWNDSAGKIQLQKLLPFPFSSNISGSIPIFSWFSQHLFLGISLYLHMLKNCIYGYFFVLRNLLDISKYWHFWHFLMVAYPLDVSQCQPSITFPNHNHIFSQDVVNISELSSAETPCWKTYHQTIQQICLAYRSLIQESLLQNMFHRYSMNFLHTSVLMTKAASFGGKQGKVACRARWIATWKRCRWSAWTIGRCASAFFTRFRDERMGIKRMGVLKMVYGENHGLAKWFGIWMDLKHQEMWKYEK